MARTLESIRETVRWTSGINLIAGLWLISAPFVLGYSYPASERHGAHATACSWRGVPNRHAATSSPIRATRLRAGVALTRTASIVTSSGIRHSASKRLSPTMSHLRRRWTPLRSLRAWISKRAIIASLMAMT